MEINKDTKLTAILEQYPWLPDELVKMDGRFGIIKTPVGKMMIRHATVKDLMEKTGLSEDELRSQLQEMIKKHES